MPRSHCDTAMTEQPTVSAIERRDTRPRSRIIRRASKLGREVWPAGVVKFGIRTIYALWTRVATGIAIVAAHDGAYELTLGQVQVYGVNMRLHDTDRYIARWDWDNEATARTVHVDVGYVIDENWVAVGHYYLGESRLLLCELAVFPLPTTLRGPASVTFDDDTRPPHALGAASTPLIRDDPAEFRWDRGVGVPLPRRSQEIYARLVRRIPFADMAIAAEAARKGFEAQGKEMTAARDSLGDLTDAAQWNEQADRYVSLGSGGSISDARKAYLQAAILFERFRDANQVRYQIAKDMGMDVSSSAKKNRSESKVRALLDGARRHNYLLTSGVSGRTSGGLTPLGRDLAAKHHPDLLEGIVS